jgi:hypothetical protein
MYHYRQIFSLAEISEAKPLLISLGFISARDLRQRPFRNL